MMRLKVIYPHRMLLTLNLCIPVLISQSLVRPRQSAPDVASILQLVYPLLDTVSCHFSSPTL